MTIESEAMLGHAAVAADLQRRIEAGEFVAGDTMPSEQALAAAYEVTRGRVRTALASLARRGLIVSRPNTGWLVQSRRQVESFPRMRSFAQWAADQGRAPGGLVTSAGRGPATEREARALRIRLDEQVYRFTRVRTLDERVVMVERSVWTPWVASVLEAMPPTSPSVTAVLAARSIDVEVGDHRIEVVSASSEDAQLLGVRRSSPLLQVTRTTASRSGRLLELGVDRYVPHVISFEIRADGTRGAAQPTTSQTVSQSVSPTGPQPPRRGSIPPGARARRPDRRRDGR